MYQDARRAIKRPGMFFSIGRNVPFYVGVNTGSGTIPTSLILASADRRTRRWSGPPSGPQTIACWAHSRGSGVGFYLLEDFLPGSPVQLRHYCATECKHNFWVQWIIKCQNDLALNFAFKPDGIPCHQNFGA